jgi:hypothetical protein
MATDLGLVLAVAGVLAFTVYHRFKETSQS